jgi:hypothetical protein
VAVTSVYPFTKIENSQRQITVLLALPPGAKRFLLLFTNILMTSSSHQRIMLYQYEAIRGYHPPSSFVQ